MLVRRREILYKVGTHTFLAWITRRIYTIPVNVAKQRCRERCINIVEGGGCDRPRRSLCGGCTFGHRSKALSRGGSDTATEDRTCDGTVDHIERAHDALDPSLVDLGHKSADSLLCDRAGRVVSKRGALSTSCRRWSGIRWWVRRISGRIGIRVHEEHEFDIATSQEAVDIIILKSVDIFEVA